jgi:DNA-binding beta-propeller fold protein YncE
MIATNRGSNSVSIFELTGADPLKAGAWKETIVPVCRNPEGLDVSPDDAQVWVGCRGSNEIAIVDLLQKKMAEAFPSGTQSVARVKFSIGGKYLLASDPTRGNLAILDAAIH